MIDRFDVDGDQRDFVLKLQIPERVLSPHFKLFLAYNYLKSVSHQKCLINSLQNNLALSMASSQYHGKIAEKHASHIKLFLFTNPHTVMYGLMGAATATSHTKITH